MLRGTTRFPPRQSRLGRRSNASNGGKPSRTTGHRCRSRGPLGSELPALLHPGALSAGEAPLWYCAYGAYFLRRCVLRIQVCNKAYVTTLRRGFQAGIAFLWAGRGKKPFRRGHILAVAPWGKGPETIPLSLKMAQSNRQNEKTGQKQRRQDKILKCYEIENFSDKFAQRS